MSVDSGTSCTTGFRTGQGNSSFSLETTCALKAPSETTYWIMPDSKSADHVSSRWAERLFIQHAPAVEVVLLVGVCEELRKQPLCEMRREEAQVAWPPEDLPDLFLWQTDVGQCVWRCSHGWIWCWHRCHRSGRGAHRHQLTSFGRYLPI